jgi:transposase-like protein
MTDFTITNFFQRFPDDDACLDHLMQVRYGDCTICPKCEKEGKFNRLSKSPAYACSWCGHHIHPMAGTPFYRSRTPLQKWFYAMYLFTTSRHGVPAKELQRQLGVTYKCAWRMGHEIRKYMGNVDGDDGLSGHVEIDETLVGGKDGKPGRPSGIDSKKVIVLGMVERDGDLMTKVVPNVKRATLYREIEANVEKGTTVSTDELGSYHTLGERGYKHGMVNHNQKQWTNGIHHTNTIEGFWSILKRAISGTHVHVSRKHLPKYLGEFEYRYNRRKEPQSMFDELLRAF